MLMKEESNVPGEPKQSQEEKTIRSIPPVLLLEVNTYS